MTPQPSSFQILLQQTATLTSEEKLRLISHLAEDLRQPQTPSIRRQWSEICGAAPYPLFGEDAQTWITRSRQDDDRHQDHILSGEA